MSPQEKASTPSVNEPYFQISPQWFEERGISLSVFLLPRLCRECRQEMQTRPDKGLETPWQEYMKRIAEHCSQEPGFITGETPVLEGVFRLLLGARNEPVPLSSLKRTLEEWWQAHGAGRTITEETREGYLGITLNPEQRTITEETLLRILQRSGAYGIRQVSPS